MKLGTLLASLSAATLVLAQPAAAATRSASSLPQPGARVEAVDARLGSPVRASERIAGNTEVVMLLALILLGAALVIFGGDDGPDPAPISPG